MSQAGVISVTATPSVPTSFVTGTAVPVANVLNIEGGVGAETSGSGNTIVVTVTGGSFTWNEVTGTSETLAIANGYVANNAGLVTLTLPTTAVFGSTIQIVGKGVGLFKIAQNAGQTINVIASSTTTGVSGSLTAIEQFASIELVCTTADTDFTVVDMNGNFTVV